MIAVGTELVVAVFNRALITVYIISSLAAKYAAIQMHIITVHVYKLLQQQQHLFCAFWFPFVCSMVWKTQLLFLPE